MYVGTNVSSFDKNKNEISAGYSIGLNKSIKLNNRLQILFDFDFLKKKI